MSQAPRPARVLPPVWFLLALVLMAVLHVRLPVARWLPWPYTLAGLALIAGGMVVAALASRQFMRRQTAIRPFDASRVLVTDGLYRYTRNPMYLGMVLILLGTGTVLGSVTPLLVTPAFAAFITVAFIAREERHLESQFGDDDRAFRARVRRWL